MIPLSSLLLTVAVALGTFQVGQFLGVSGAVAVVIAGLIFGNFGISGNTSASSRITLLSFWGICQFYRQHLYFSADWCRNKPLTLWRLYLLFYLQFWLIK
jgi:CPA1 family monovalent cation:H+ antiporter